MKLDSDTMNATQRAIAVIHHEEPDRLPIFLMGVPQYSKCFTEIIANDEEILDQWTENEENVLITPMGDFTLRYNLGSEIENKSIGLIRNFTNKHVDKQGNILGDFDLLEKNKLLNQLREKNSNAGKEGKGQEQGQGIKYRFVNYGGTIHGLTILPNGQEYDWYIDGFLKKEEDILNWYETYGWESEQKVSKIDVNTFKQFQTDFGDKIYLIPQIGGNSLYESLWPMMGQGRFGYFCRKKPELIHKLVESRKEAQLHILEEIEKIHPVAIFGGDDMGQKGRSLMSPAMFRKFFFRPYKEIFDKVHEMGAIIYIHSCGNIMDLLPDLIEAGLDGWQSMEVPSEIDHAALKKKYGDKLLLVGGIDSSRVLTMGSPNDVKQHVKKQIIAMGKGGGYIAGPAHDYLNVPLENALAMRDAIYEYGKYPLNTN